MAVPGTAPALGIAVGTAAVFPTARLRTAVARMARGLRPTAAAGPLTTTEVDLLLVCERRGPASMSDMAAFCGLNPTMLSRMVPRLEQSGLLRRRVGPEDRRVSKVTVTNKGRALIERVRSERNDALSKLVAELPGEEVRALEAAVPVLEKLGERLRGSR